VRIKTALAVVAFLAFPVFGASTFYLDFEGGNDANDGTSFANRWKTFESGATAARTAPGDTIRVMGSLSPTSLGTALWTNDTRTITLSTAGITESVSTCELDWTASPNVTCTTSATRKEGAKSASFAFALGFTTGLAAYYDIADTTTLDGYQQLSFWIQSNATIVANTFKISLCSDDAGVTEVDTFTIPFAINPVNQWHRVTINKGSNLGDPIKSVALYCLLDPGIPTVLIDNIFASKSVSSADCLTLNSVVSKGNGLQTAVDDPRWYPIVNVVGTTVEINGETTLGTGAQYTYRTTTETVTTYVSQTMVVGPNANQLALVQEGGTIGLPITYSGGWNRTDMSSRTYMTWISTPNATGSGIFGNLKNYVNIEYFGILGGATGIFAGSMANNYTHVYAVSLNCYTTSGTNLGKSIFTNCVFEAGNNATFCIKVGSFDCYPLIFKDCTFAECQGYAVDLRGYQLRRFINCRFDNLAWGAFADTFKSPIANPYTFADCKFINIRTADLIMTPNSYVSMYNCIFTKGMAWGAAAGLGGGGAYVVSTLDQQVAATSKIFSMSGTIEADAVTRHTASGFAWKATVTTATGTNKDFPLYLRVFNKNLTASTAYTVSAWMRRSNTALHCWLWCPVQVGVATEIYSSAEVSATDTYEQLSLAVTPTVTSPICVYAIWYADSGTTYVGYVDDVSVTP